MIEGITIFIPGDQLPGGSFWRKRKKRCFQLAGRTRGSSTDVCDYTTLEFMTSSWSQWCPEARTEPLLTKSKEKSHRKSHKSLHKQEGSQMDGLSSTPASTDSPNTTLNGKVLQGEHSNVMSHCWFSHCGTTNTGIQFRPQQQINNLRLG